MENQREKSRHSATPHLMRGAMLPSATSGPGNLQCVLGGALQAKPWPKAEPCTSAVVHQQHAFTLSVRALRSTGDSKSGEAASLLKS